MYILYIHPDIVCILRRIREKFENELHELEKSEQEAKKKYLETKNKLLESEDNVVTLKATIKQLNIQMVESKEVLKCL